MPNLIKQFARDIRSRIRGKYLNIKAEIDCPRVWCGSDYGGFYVNPETLPPEPVVYSFGIGEDISFDRALLKNHAASIFAFDPTPKSIEWIKDQSLPEKFHFFDFGIGNESGKTIFYLPKNKDYVSGSILDNGNVDLLDAIEVPIRSFPDILATLKHTQIDILKMDIEGSEYDVLESILNCDVIIKQLAIEFHHRFMPDGVAKSKAAIRLLRENDYAIFGVSPSKEEVSFIKTS